jgi:hypothetical protein
VWVQPIKAPYEVVATDEQVVNHAGVGLLAELADRVGLTTALDRLVSTAPAASAGTRPPGCCAT